MSRKTCRVRKRKHKGDILGHQYSVGIATKSDKKELQEYYCVYCGNWFKQYIRMFGSRVRHQSNNCITTQVKCPKCGNFLPTFGYRTAKKPARNLLKEVKKYKG